MPYGKRFRRKTYSKKRSFKRTKFSRRVPKKIKRYVKRTLDAKIEDKYIDYVVFNSITPNYNGVITGIALPAAGTALDQRIGNTITPKKLKLWGQIYGTDPHMMRVIGFVWHGLDTPTIAQIIDPNSIGNFLCTQAPYSETFKGNKQYTIIYDKTTRVGDANSRFSNPIKYTIPGKKMRKITFSTAIGPGMTNYIYFIAIQDGFATLDSILMKCRLYFEDA